ncbi:MAG: tetratricopeptide repeat protein [Gemmatimonadetes bacterium]|nr:tetratricopeptide repeat protein [Gemmatimonadota bacterium]
MIRPILLRLRGSVATLAALSLLGAPALEGQRPQESPSPGALAPGLPDTLRPMARATALGSVDRLYDAFDPRASLAAADALLESDPEDYEVLWRASRAAVVLGSLAEEEDVQDAWFLRGAGYGERAMALRPEGVEALYWLGASKGRLALQQGPRTTAALAQEVYDLAHRVLTLDSLHAGGHNILGKLNYEVMTLTAFERFLARLILGNEALRSASWELAEHHFSRSLVSEPEVVLFHFDLGKMYLAQGRLEEARDAFLALLDLPDRHPPDPGWKAETRRLLADVQRRLGR